jgi:phosphoribosylglycinamide formyltransferase 1
VKNAAKRLVVLISGRGSNMEALLAAKDAGELNADITAVISNRSDAKGLDTARTRGITALALPHRDYASRDAFDAALMRGIDAQAPDLVVLAGFMRILTPIFVQHYAGRLINIHPSLLPSFPGLDTHARALAAGCKVHGATVHFVTPELDHGPIVIQAAVPVLASDDEASLAARVLRQEHVIYPRAVRWFVEGKLTVQGGIVRVATESDSVLNSPKPSSASSASQLVFQDA